MILLKQASGSPKIYLVKTADTTAGAEATEAVHSSGAVSNHYSYIE